MSDHLITVIIVCTSHVVSAAINAWAVVRSAAPKK